MNNQGQLGYGTYSTDSNNKDYKSSMPVQVMRAANTPLTNIKQIAVSYNHTLALSTDGKIYGWGSYDSYALGNIADPYLYAYATELFAGQLKNVVSIEAGWYSTYAITEDGDLYAWGSNFGYTPVHVSGGEAGTYLTDVVQVLSTNRQTMALRSNGTVFVWGSQYVTSNTTTYLGGNAIQSSNTPVQMLKGTEGPSPLTNQFLEQVTSIDVANVRLFTATTSAGKVYYWGYGNKNQVGDSVSGIFNEYLPQELIVEDYEYAYVKNTSGLQLYVDKGGYVTARNSSVKYTETLGQTLSVAGTINQQSVGVICKNGTVRTIGYNSYGQLGDGSTNNSITTSVPVGGGANDGLILSKAVITNGSTKVTEYTNGIPLP